MVLPNEKNRHITETAPSLHLSPGAPYAFWAEVVLTSFTLVKEKKICLTFLKSDEVLAAFKRKEFYFNAERPDNVNL